MPNLDPSQSQLKDKVRACLSRGNPSHPISCVDSCSLSFKNIGVHCYSFYRVKGNGLCALLIMKEDKYFLILTKEESNETDLVSLRDMAIGHALVGGMNHWMTSRTLSTSVAEELWNCIYEGCASVLRGILTSCEEVVIKQKCENYLEWALTYTRFGEMLLPHEEAAREVARNNARCISILQSPSISVEEWINYKDGIPFLTQEDSRKLIRINPDSMMLENPLLAFSSVTPSLSNIIKRLHDPNCNLNYNPRCLRKLMQLAKSEPNTKNHGNRIRLHS